MVRQERMHGLMDSESPLGLYLPHLDMRLPP